MPNGVDSLRAISARVTDVAGHFGMEPTMRIATIPTRLRWLMAGVAGLTVLGVAAPALAQGYYDDEIVVTGRYGEVPDNVDSISQAVTYSDLDLATPAGWDILRHRVSRTATDLCDRLGESDTASGLVPSCHDAAYRDAMDRVGTVDQDYAPTYTAWAGPPRY
jgi:UrcA family protein